MRGATGFGAAITLGLAGFAPAGAAAMDCAEAQTHDVWICEPLHDGAGAAETFGGGTFTGAGYQLWDDPSSRLHWDLHTQVERGHVEWVLEGASLAALGHANMHLLELFDDGGHWSAERAINVRAYGDDGVDEWGDLKFLLFDRGPEPDFVAEARYHDMDWDGLPHRWAIDWDPERATLSVDGTVLFDYDLTGMDTRMGHVWLPLNDWTADYSGVAGAVYSDLVLAADLPGTTPDVPGGDTTIAGNVLTTVAVEDTCAIGGDAAGLVFGADDSLSVSGDDGGNPLEVGYLKFEVTGIEGAATAARIRVRTTEGDDAVGGGGSAYVADSGWTEETVTWNTRPTWSGSPHGRLGTLAPSTDYSYDVTGTVTGDGTYAFALVSTDGNSTHYVTKEGSLATAPRLEVTFDPSASDDDTTPPGDDDTGPADDDAAADDDSADATGTQDFGGACEGCGGSAKPGRVGAAGVLALLLAARRRRARLPRAFGSGWPRRAVLLDDIRAFHVLARGSRRTRSDGTGWSPGGFRSG